MTTLSARIPPLAEKPEYLLNSFTYLQNNFEPPTQGEVDHTLQAKLKEKQKKDEQNQLQQTYAQLTAMRNWPANWDTYGAIKPKKTAIKKAERFIQKLFEFTQEAQYKWISPNVTASADGEVMLEWWGTNKKLTIYLSTTEIMYIKIEKENIDDMEDSNLELNKNAIGSLWGWFIT